MVSRNGGKYSRILRLVIVMVAKLYQLKFNEIHRFMKSKFIINTGLFLEKLSINLIINLLIKNYTLPKK